MTKESIALSLNDNALGKDIKAISDAFNGHCGNILSLMSSLRDCGISDDTDMQKLLQKGLTHCRNAYAACVEARIAAC